MGDRRGVAWHGPGPANNVPNRFATGVLTAGAAGSHRAEDSIDPLNFPRAHADEKASAAKKSGCAAAARYIRVLKTSISFWQRDGESVASSGTFRNSL